MTQTGIPEKYEKPAKLAEQINWFYPVNLAKPIKMHTSISGKPIKTN